ncbi:TPA: hypothetical protein HA270_06425 [Candidatus Woesearchaeota archaeon]|nr:hypothetical protein [Candidatus Woesearchaeota archaeon]
MFDSSIEKKIVDFVKHSPLGVTSTELAKSLGINRITLSKYLDIIRERSLIDFRQLGMAKLWYIPVHLSQEEFLKKLSLSFLHQLGKGSREDALRETGREVGSYINSLYASFHGVEKLKGRQFEEMLRDAGEKIGGKLIVTELNEGRYAVCVERCPIEFASEDITDMKEMGRQIFLEIVAINFSGGTVEVSEEAGKIVYHLQAATYEGTKKK